MPHVQLDGVAFAYADAAPVLSIPAGAGLRLEAGWTAVVGENGAGKTTLLRIVAGDLAPGAGRVRTEPPRARVALCPQEVAEPGPGVHALAHRDDGEARRLRGALALDPAALARWPTLSPGERKRWQIGAALAADPDVLLLDEPTNHVDADARAALAGALRRFRGVSVALGRADRVHVAGPNGSGKSSLVAALLARAALPAGRVLHLPQELGAGEGARVLAEVRALDPATRGRVLSLVASLGSDPARLLASRSPSPGEARKLLLALGLGRHAWALVLDEPTNHLDLPTIERLEAALRAYPGALLLVTHDDALAAACTAVRWRLGSGRVHVE